VTLQAERPEDDIPQTDYATGLAALASEHSKCREKFFHLMRLKTWMRSRMGEERLTYRSSNVERPS